MNILHLTLPDSDPYGHLMAQQLSQLLINTGCHSLIKQNRRKSPPAFFPGLRLSGYLRRGEYDVAIVHSPHWLQACTTAAGLSGSDCKTAFMPSCPLSQIPDSPQFIAALRQVDKILLPYPAIKEAFVKKFGEEFRNDEKLAIAIPEFEIPIKREPAKDRVEISTPLNPAFPIRELISRIVNDTPAALQKIHFTVRGEGKGNFVMPLIRMTRKANVDVEWAGMPLLSNDAMSATTALLTCYGDNKPLFDCCTYAARQNGIPVFAELNKLFQSLTREKQTTDDTRSSGIRNHATDYATKLISLFLAL